MAQRSKKNSSAKPLQPPVRILLVEKNTNDIATMKRELRNEKLKCVTKTVSSKSTFLKELKSFSPALILSNHTLPRFKGITALRLTKQHDPTLPFIVLSDSENELVETQFITAGADGFLTREQYKKLGKSIRSVIEKKRLNGEQEQLIHQLSESEQQFRLITESATELIALLDLNGKRIYNNPAYEKTLGGDPEKLRGTDSFREIHPDDRDYIKRVFQETVKSGVGQRAEFRFLLNDGSIRYVESLGNVIKNEKGKPEKILVVSRDITERKLQENTLREREQQFRHITENATELIALLDLEGKRIYNNPAYEKTLGGDPNSLRGTDSFREIHPEDREYVKNIFQKTVKTGVGQYAEFRFLRNDGTIRYIESQGTVIRNEKGKPEKILVVSRDITERKLQEHTLREREQQFRNITENATELIALLDLSGKRIYNNPAYEKTLGGDPKRLRGTDSFREIHPEDRKKIKQIFEETVRTGIGQRAEFRFLLYDGTVRFVESQGSVIKDENGKPEKVLVVSRDISEQKHREQILVESEQRYRLLIERMNEGLLQVDNNDVILFANNRFCEIIGYSLEELLGKISKDFLISDKDKKIIEEKNKLRKQGVSDSYEVEMRKKTGDVLSVRISGAPVHDAFGTVIGSVGIIVDVTKEKKTEREILEWKQRTELLVAASNQLMYDYNVLEGTIIWSGPVEQMLDYTPAEMNGGVEQWMDMLHPEDRNEALRLLNIAEKNLSPYDVEYRFRTKKGTYLWMHDRGFFLSNDEGKAVRMLGMMQDITERKNAELQLRASENHLRTIIEAEPECVKIVNAQGVLLHMNSAGLAMIEANALEQIQGKVIYGLIAPEYRTAFQTLIQNVCRGNREILEFDIIGLNGTRRNLETHSVPLQLDNKETVALGVTRDITERKKSELVQSALYRISEATDGALSLQELYSAIHKIIGEVMDAHNFYIALYDEDNDEIAFPYFVDEVDTPSPPKKFGNGLTEYVFRTGKSLLCTTEVHLELMTRGEADLVGKPSAIWLGVPLIIENKTIGVMVVQHYTDERAYQAREQQILEYVSSQIARAIHHVHSEEKVRQSEERYQIVSKATNDVIWDWNLLTNDVVWGNNFSTVFGYSPEEIINSGDFWDGLIHPDDKKKILNDIDRAHKLHKTSWTGEYRYRRKNGSYAHVFDRAFILYSDTGTPMRAIGAMMDITQQKYAEQKLSESEERFRALIENNSDVIALIAADGTILYKSPSIQKVFGYAPDELIGKNSAELIHPDDLLTLQETFPELLHTVGNKQNATFRYKHKNGSWRWVESVSMNLLAEKSINAIVVNYRDITERKRSELERQIFFDITQAAVTTANLDELLPLIHQAVKKVVYAENFFIVLYNKETGMFESVYDRDLNDPPFPPFKMGKSSSAYVFRTGMPVMMTQEVFDQLAASGEVELIGSNSPAWIGIPLKTSDETIGVMVLQHYEDPNAYSQRDMEFLTSVGNQIALAIERKHSEQLLTASEEKYRHFFEQDLTADYIATREGNILLCNPAFLSLFGFSSFEEAYATNADSLYSESFTRNQMLSLLTEKKHLENFEMELRRRDGTPVFVIANIFGRFNEKGELIDKLTYLFDTTQRKKLEEQLRQSQKMEAIGHLASGIAHDFNNVLAGLLGYAEMGLRRTDPNNPLYTTLDKIRSLTERGAKITKQLLAFSRRQIIDPKDVNLNKVITDLLSLISKTIGDNIEIDFSPEHSLKTVHADVVQLEQVLMNLCVNARDAMPNGGRLIIETHNTILDERYVKTHPTATNGPYVLLAVTDTGFGMDKKTIEQIFDPFFTTKETGKGTGLGLSMVHGIVAQHSGFVNVYSEVGKGTTLKIYLPAVERVAAEQKEKTATAIIGGNETILLVEDDTEVREMVDSVLKEFGYTVIVAEDGEDGLRKFQENASAIHMVVSDSVMPKMGGKELHQHIVKIQPDVKFLFVSGYTENAVHHNFILENEVNFLQKPFTPLDLAAKVREVIDRR